MAIELINISTSSEWGNEAPKINENNQKLVSEIIKSQNSEGSIKWYSNSTELDTERPNPNNGETAWVGAMYPGTVWAVREGKWTDTKIAPDVNSVDLVGYAKSGGSPKSIKQLEYESNTITRPVNINSTAVDTLSNTADTVIFEPYKVTFKSSGFYFYVSGKMYLLSGADDYIINISKAQTRSYVFIDPASLTSQTLSWVDKPDLFEIYTETNPNIENHFINKVLLFSTYEGNPVPSGLLGSTISKILARDNHKIHVSFIDSAERGDVVKLDNKKGILIFPKNFIVHDNESTLFTSGLNTPQEVPTRCTNYLTGAFENSSIGYLFLNKETLEIKNFWWDQLNIIPSQIWKMIGSVKRSISDKDKIGEVSHISGLFEWESLGGSFADKAQSNSGIADSLSSTNNNIVILNGGITFKKEGFSLYLHGKRYTIAGNEDLTITVNTSTTRINLYIDTRLLSVSNTTNWNNTENLFFTTTLDNDPALSDNYLLLSFYQGVPMPVGLLSEIATRPFTSGRFAFRHCFYGRSTSNEKIKIIPSEKKMVIPSSIAICDEFAPEIFYTPIGYHEVSLIPEDWNGTPQSTSSGLLVYNREKGIFKNIWWSRAFAFPKSEKWYVIGSIKRDTATTSTSGNIIFQSTLEADYIGSNDSDVILRNQDIDTIIDAAINRKYVDGKGNTDRFSFIHISDVHADVDRYNNALQYLNYKENIASMFVTGDIQSTNFTDPVEWFIQSVNDNSKPITLTIGNHDTGNSKTISVCGTNQQAYTKYIQPIETKSGLITNAKNYWYKDFAAYKIRIISIYEYDDPNDIDQNDASQYRIYRGARVLSQQQIDWLLNTLDNTPKDYAVIMLTHQNPSTSETLLSKNSDWTSQTGNLNPFNLTNGVVLNEIIDAWMLGTAINKTYNFTGDASYLPPIVANRDFSTRGKGEFVAFFFGHHHSDSIGSFTNYPKQNYVCITCGTADYLQTKYDDLPRTIGQRSEDAFNVVSVDRSLGKLFVVRVGSNMNSSFKERKYKVINYK